MNTLMVLLLYIILYAFFLTTGQLASRFVFKKSNLLAILLAPLVSFSLFTLIATNLMYFFTGQVAGSLSFIGILLIAMLAGVIYPFRSSCRSLVKAHLPGMVAGVIFLAPLLLSNNLGIFALNGADFGSYAGWGSYFSHHTLIEGRPTAPYLNSTLAGFANLQEELASPHAAWRIGNISLFSAFNALVPESLWPTCYMVILAFCMGQFALATQLFCRYVLFQSTLISRQVGWLAILLNTVYWLGMSHYTPNIIGLVLTLDILAILFNVDLKRLPKIGISLCLSALLWLVYPESSIFIALLSSLLLFFRLVFSNPSKCFKRLACFLFPLPWIAVGVFILDFQAFFTLFRHLHGVLGYYRPGDYVGIFGWGYFSQLFGFADYNSLLLQYRDEVTKTATVIGYACVGILLINQFVALGHKNAPYREKIVLSFLLGLLLFVIPMTHYALDNQWLLVWRSMLTLSPYLWIVLSIIGLRVLKRGILHLKELKHSHYLFVSTKVNSRLLRQVISIHLPSAAFISLVAVAILFRVLMLKMVIIGSDHGEIFGTKYLSQIHSLKNKTYDSVFIEYEGSGTIQGGWEFYSQYYPFIFPEHGTGRNEYEVSVLQNKIIAVIGGLFNKVQRLKGFESPENGSVQLSTSHNILIPYSSTWVYMKEVKPSLTLVGLPGKLIFWSQESTQACLDMKVHASRQNASLRVSINDNIVDLMNLNSKYLFTKCAHFKKGMNVIRLEPLDMTKQAIQARAKLIEEIENKLTKTEYESGLLTIYRGGFKEKNPFSSPKPEDWGTNWNIITPEDVFPLNPYITFDEITLRKQNTPNAIVGHTQSRGNA